MEARAGTILAMDEPLYNAYVQLDILAADVKLVSKNVCIISKNLAMMLIDMLISRVNNRIIALICYVQKRCDFNNEEGCCE